jgi:hypothetical protein
VRSAARLSGGHCHAADVLPPTISLAQARPRC